MKKERKKTEPPKAAIPVPEIPEIAELPEPEEPEQKGSEQEHAYAQ